MARPPVGLAEGVNANCLVGITGRFGEWREYLDPFPVRVYDRRHTYLTSVKGLPVDVLKRIAGQSDLATTRKCYTNTTDRDADEFGAAPARSGMTKPRIAVGS